MTGALDGVRVIELATGVAGPFCGKLLAGLGAEVIKVEPPAGDPSRLEGPFPGDVPDRERSGLFLHLNTGKQSLALPKDDAAWPAETTFLLGTADVLLLSERPSELRARGWDLDGLRRRFPWLVVTSVTPFGLTGPYADLEGGELVCYALSGYMMLTGEPQRQPLKAYGSLLHYEAGLQAALGTLAALRARETTGEGQVVDVSVMEAGTFLMGGVDQPAYFYGRIARRNGTRLMGLPPEQPYPSTIRPCRDGYVHAHSNNRHVDLLAALVPHPRLLDPELLGSMLGHADEIDAILDAWLADKNRAEIVEQAQALRLPFTEVMTPGEVLADRHHRERGSFVTIDHPGAGPVVQPGAPVRMSETPWVTGPAPMLGQHTEQVRARRFDGLTERGRRYQPTGERAKPLAGVRVCELTIAVAGPLTGTILADLGAEVIKVEPPNGRPRQAKGTAPLQEGATDEPWNRIMVFNEINHGKRSVTLDLTTPEGKGLFLKLVAASDVVLHNLSPRAMDNLGLDYALFRQQREDIIAVSMPAFGLGGPYRDRGSYGPGIDAMSGFSHLTGYADSSPGKPGNFFLDQNAAVLAAFCTLAALRHRDRERSEERSVMGHGQHVELPMIEGEFQLIGDAFIDYAMNGRERMRCGNDHDRWAPHDSYRSQGDDAWVAIAVTSDAQWRALCGVIERPELADDPRFAAEADRHRNREALRPIIEAWAGERSHYEAQEALQAAGVPAGAVLNAVELFGDPHVVARGGFETVETLGVGTTPYPRVAFRLSETPVPVSGPAPGFGADNDAVLGGLLGVGAETLAELAERRIIAYEPP